MAMLWILFEISLRNRIVWTWSMPTQIYNVGVNYAGQTFTKTLDEYIAPSTQN